MRGTLEQSEGNRLQAVSNAMVKLHKEQFGRGPTNARSFFAGDDSRFRHPTRASSFGRGISVTIPVRSMPSPASSTTDTSYSNRRFPLRPRVARRPRANDDMLSWLGVRPVKADSTPLVTHLAYEVSSGG